MGEFCQWETFNASCRSDEVVVVTAARYGRMRAGRCASRSYGAVGCSVDVLPYLAARCSGRHACHLVVPDRHLREMRPCPIDFAAYLEAGYKCVPGLPTVVRLAFRLELTVIFYQMHYSEFSPIRSVRGRHRSYVVPENIMSNVIARISVVSFRCWDEKLCSYRRRAMSVEMLSVATQLYGEVSAVAI